MKAWVLNNINELSYSDVEKPILTSDSVLVKVKACGVCSSDIPRVFVNGTYHFPTIPGHEFSGIVEEVGDDKNKFLIGKHVCVFPLIPCKECKQCQKHNYVLCDNYNFIGSRRNGAFAEYVDVPIWNLMLIDDSVPFESAAMLEPLAVASHVVNLANISSDDKVAIVGTGMIGLSEAYLASLKSNDVTVFGRNDDKKKYVDLIKNVKYESNCLNNNIKYSKVIEAVGNNDAINLSFELVDTNGTLVLMGNPSDDVVLKKNNYWKILRKELTVKGCWNSKYEYNDISDWYEIKKLLESKKIDPRIFISHTFYQDELKNGLDMMFNHDETYCKVMTIWN